MKNLTDQISQPACSGNLTMIISNFRKSYRIVIERVLERGDLNNWREMIQYYSKEQILETIDWSSQLEERDKHFSRLFINSDFVNAE